MYYKTYLIMYVAYIFLQNTSSNWEYCIISLYDIILDYIFKNYLVLNSRASISYDFLVTIFNIIIVREPQRWASFMAFSAGALTFRLRVRS